MTIATHHKANDLRLWIELACARSIRRRALCMALVVGSLLALINHGDALFAGQLGAPQLARIALTYLVPYCVSTWASVQATRHANKSGKLGTGET